MKSLVNKQRILFLDYARILCAFLVIYGHLYSSSDVNYVRIFIYQFHMALFFVVSGMLHKYNGNVQIKKYFKTIIIPVVFFSTVIFILFSMMYNCGYFGFRSAPTTDIVGDNFFETTHNYLIYIGILSLKGESFIGGPCWFLLVLFYCKILTDFACINKKLTLSFASVLFVVCCGLKIKYLFLAQALMAFPFYYLAYKYKKAIINKVEDSSNWWILVCFLLVIIMMMLNGRVSMSSVKFGNSSSIVHKILSVPLFYISGASGSFMLLKLSQNFKYYSSLVTFCANSLITILGAQLIFIALCDNIIGYDLNYFVSIPVAILIFIMCIGIHYLLNKFCPVLIGKQNGR